MIPPVNASNVINSMPNAALFGEFLTHMCKFFTSNVDDTATVSNLASVSNAALVVTLSNVTNVAMVTAVPGVATSNVSTYSLANVWSGNVSDLAYTSSISPISTGHILEKSSGVPETAVKEALVCDMSPLGFHLSVTIKEKIWKHDYVDILSLLPSAKDS